MKIGYEISFNRYFYKPQPMRPLEEIRADILALERETDGLLADILGAAPQREATGRRFAVAGSCPDNREDTG